MHTCGSRIRHTKAGSHCTHKVSHRPLTRHPGTHSNPIFPSPVVPPAAGGTNTDPPLLWGSSDSSTSQHSPGPQIQSQTHFYSQNSVRSPLAVSKTKLNIVRVSSPSQHYKHWEIPGVFWSVPQDRSTEHINPSLTKFVDAHKAASLLTNWGSSEALRQPQVCASS